MQENLSQKLLEQCSVIYIDSSALMSTEQISRFIEKNKSFLLQAGKSIIVPDAVCQELTRHTTGNDIDKIQKASQAQKIIREHEDIFHLEDADYSWEALRKAFADNELLTRLLLYKRDATQLLITKDKGLGRDALRLNDQESVFGKQISACDLDKNGDLQYFRSSSCNDQPIIIKEPVYIRPEPEVVERIIEKPVYIERNPEKPKSDTGKIIIGVLFGWAMGCASFRYGKQILAHMRFR